MGQNRVQEKSLAFLSWRIPNIGIDKGFNYFRWTYDRFIFIEIDFYAARLQWVALLEFSNNKEDTDFSWQNVNQRLPRTDKLRDMVRRGIPHSLRPQIWMQMSGNI